MVTSWEVNSLAKIYYRAVKSGKRTLEGVPDRWRDEVRQMLEADGE